jgi:MFS transporter, putative metabolite:H+ symporter
MAEIRRARLRATGMGLSYDVGNCGKFIGPLGLALIVGAGDLIKLAAPNLGMLGPALSYFAAWYILGVIGFCSGSSPRAAPSMRLTAARRVGAGL